MELFGLKPLIDVASTTSQFVSKDLINVFVERWYLEITSFHMRKGEITITLGDVNCLTCLRVEGTMLGKNMPTRDTSLITMQKALGISGDLAKEGLGERYGQTVSLDWLRSNFKRKVTPEAELIRADTCFYEYMLYVLGTSLFCDKNGSRVSVIYLIDTWGEEGAWIYCENSTKDI